MTRVRLSREGAIFLAGVLVIVLIALAYVNNLAFLFAFGLLAISLLSVIVARAQVRDVEVRPAKSPQAFAGIDTDLEFEISSLNGTEPVVVQLALTSPLGDGQVFASETVEVRPRDSTRVPLCCKGLPRGRYWLDQIEVASQYPLGVFRASRSTPIGQSFYVYPEPRGSKSLPHSRIGSFGEGEEGRGGGEDFSGHRAAQPGESDRRIDWKIFARRGDKMAKEFRGGGDRYLWLRLSETPGLSREEQLSQLCLWILTADENAISYGLELDGLTIPLGHGSYQKRRCLEALALFKEAA